MYSPEGFADVLHRDGFEGSWLDWLLKETEVSHGQSIPSSSPIANHIPQRIRSRAEFFPCFHVL